jgi:hypothetical protein
MITSGRPGAMRRSLAIALRDRKAENKQTAYCVEQVTNGKATRNDAAH